MIFERTNKVRTIDAALRIVGERRIFRLNKKSLLNPTWSKPVGPEMSAAQAAARAAHDAEFRARLRDLPEDELFRYTRGLVRTYMAFSGRDLSAEVHRISAPVHIIHGTAGNTSDRPRRAITTIFHGPPGRRAVPLERPWLSTAG